MDKDSIGPMNWHIHKHRIKEEMIFQRLIKEPALASCKVEDLSNLAHELFILVSNLDSDLENRQSTVLVTDDLANKKSFVTNMLSDYLFRE